MWPSRSDRDRAGAFRGFLTAVLFLSASGIQSYRAGAFRTFIAADSLERLF